MTLKKFAVDYSKIKNDAPKVHIHVRTRRTRNFFHDDTLADVVDRVDTLLYEAAQALAHVNVAPLAFGADKLCLTPKVAALYKVHAAVELVRRLKKDSKAGRSSFVKPKVSWFRDYYEYTGLRIRSNSTTKYYVELHIGAHGWQMWQMLLALGYTPDQDEFWLELDSFISAPIVQSVELENVDSSLFMEMM